MAERAADAPHETARAALRSAFGPVPTGSLVPLSGGASGAVPFRTEVGGRSYLVRVEGPASPLRNPHQYESLRIAAEAGLAPRLHHVDEVARVAVMDFITERPLDRFPGGPNALASALGTLLRRLQETPSFPAFVAYPDLVARLWAHVRRTGLFAVGVLDPCTDRLDAIRATPGWGDDGMVSSHNDPVPRNILFDGERLWLVDWESACRNDRMVDAAILLDHLAPSPELEDAFVLAWLARRPDEAEHARLQQARALARLYYAGVLLSAAAAALGPIADADPSAPSAGTFRRAVREGRVVPGAPATKHLLGKMYLAAFRTGDLPPGLDAAT